MKWTKSEEFCIFNGWGVWNDVYPKPPLFFLVTPLFYTIKYDGNDASGTVSKTQTGKNVRAYGICDKIIRGFVLFCRLLAISIWGITAPRIRFSDKSEYILTYYILTNNRENAETNS